MIDNQYDGIFIVFEGLNGSGKTTQAKMLYDHYKMLGQYVLLTKEPTLDSQAGKKIEKVLHGHMTISPTELQELMVEDRKEHLEKFITVALRSRNTVICDRYFLSTIAFGGLDLDTEWLIELNNNFILPDFTFLIDTSPDVCLQRIAWRGQEKKIFDQKQKMIKVRKNYLSLAKRFKDIYLIKGDLPAIDVGSQIHNIL